MVTAMFIRMGNASLCGDAVDLRCRLMADLLIPAPFARSRRVRAAMPYASPATWPGIYRNRCVPGS